MTTAAPWGRAEIHPECPEEPQIRLESGGEAERSPIIFLVQPLDFHLVSVGSMPTGPTHGEGRLQPHPRNVLKSTPNVRKRPRSCLNLEGRLSDTQIVWRGGHARRGVTTVAPWGRAEIHPECPDEPQIRPESGGEAERSPNFAE